MDALKKRLSLWHHAVVVDDLFGETYSFLDAIPILLGERIVSEEHKLFFRP